MNTPSQKRFQPRWVFLACLLLLVARGYRRLIHPEIWAEDGTIFLQESLEHGWASLMIPHLGSYHTLQRLFVLAATAIFPLRWLAGLITAFGFATVAFAFSYFSRPTFRSLIPSDGTRVLACLLLCFSPGLNEMLGNLSNFNWMLYLLLSFLCLKSPSEKDSWLELAGMGLIAVSIGTFPLCIPLLLWRGYRQHLVASPLARQSFGVAAVLVLLTAWLVVHPADRPEAAHAKLSSMASIYLKHFFDFLVVRPWFGDRALIFMDTRMRWLTFGIGYAVLLAVGAWLWKKRRDVVMQSLLLWVALTSLWVVLCWLSRPRSFASFATVIEPNFLRMRYTFPMAAIAVFLWVWIVSQARVSQTTRRCLFGWLIICQVGFSLYRFRISPYGFYSLWNIGAAKLEAGARVPIYPERWCVSPVKTDRRCTLPELSPLTDQQQLDDWNQIRSVK